MLNYRLYAGYLKVTHPLTHKQHADVLKLPAKCTVKDRTIGGLCLNCGWIDPTVASPPITGGD